MGMRLSLKGHKCLTLTLYSLLQGASLLPNVRRHLINLRSPYRMNKKEKIMYTSTTCLSYLKIDF